jgi:hypothetical protein
MFRRRRVIDELTEAIRISKQLEGHTVTMLSDFEQALNSMRSEVVRLTEMNSELEQAAQRKKDR